MPFARVENRFDEVTGCDGTDGTGGAGAGSGAGTGGIGGGANNEWY